MGSTGIGALGVPLSGGTRRRPVLASTAMTAGLYIPAIIAGPQELYPCAQSIGDMKNWNPERQSNAASGKSSMILMIGTLLGSRPEASLLPRHRNMN
jgi:hypothetical protein